MEAKREAAGKLAPGSAGVEGGGNSRFERSGEKMDGSQHTGGVPGEKERGLADMNHHSSVTFQHRQPRRSISRC